MQDDNLAEIRPASESRIGAAKRRTDPSALGENKGLRRNSDDLLRIV